MKGKSLVTNDLIGMFELFARLCSLSALFTEIFCTLLDSNINSFTVFKKSLKKYYYKQ